MDLASKDYVCVLVEEPVQEQWFRKNSSVCAHDACLSQHPCVKHPLNVA